MKRGRRFDGLIEPKTKHDHDKPGELFAEMAFFEAASVIAYRRLERELQSFDAPGELIARAREARADEARHARTMTRLAKRFGGEVQEVEHQPIRRRLLFAFAMENAVEGCVGETFGALVASYQARVAADPEVRAELAIVARDEAKHAALAAEIAAWLAPQLTEAQRAAIARAQADEIAWLRRAAGRANPARELEALAGLPSQKRALGLIDALERRLLPALAAA